MTEKLVKVWMCDICGTERRRGLIRPVGWHEAHVCYANYIHCCHDLTCVQAFVSMCVLWEVDLPETILSER